MKVVLIPGMDGTGALFKPFIDVAPTGIEVVCLPLLQDPDVGYEEVEGTHFVLQTNPVECWQVIQSANV